MDFILSLRIQLLDIILRETIFLYRTDSHVVYQVIFFYHWILKKRYI